MSINLLTDINFFKNNISDIIKLYAQLTVMHNITNEQVISFYENRLKSGTYAYLGVMENDKIVGMVTILFDKKIYRDMQCVGHIEDLVIDKNSRKKGYGNKLLKIAIELCKHRKCYKIILNCKNQLKKFYEINGFVNNNLCMVMYIK